MYNIRTSLAVKVTELLTKHKGGERYFDALDDALSQPNYINALLCDYCNQYDTFDVSKYYLFVSGKFGMKVREFISTYPESHPFRHIKLIVLEGGLRHNPEKLDKVNLFLEGNYKYGYFMDDSYYAGRTYTAIYNLAKRYNVSIIKSFVLYNGSPDRKYEIYSLYRYYDYHKEK